jgi:hypothetical protein
MTSDWHCSLLQVFSQPVFHGIEQMLTDHVPGVRRLPAWGLRIIVRTVYVCFTTTVAAVMPFFTDIIGLVRFIAVYDKATCQRMLCASAGLAGACCCVHSLQGIGWLAKHWRQHGDKVHTVGFDLTSNCSTLKHCVDVRFTFLHACFCTNE